MKIASGLMLALLLACLLSGIYGIGPVRATGTVYREYDLLDTTPPTITVLSPENKTYFCNSVPLTLEVDEPAPWIGYSLDGQSNITLPGLFPYLKFRKGHAIANASMAGTDYQIRIAVWRTVGTDSGENVYVGTKCRSDFGDIRFTKSDGTSPLYYWLASYDSTKAIFWVKIPDNLSVASTTIYMYYGNDNVETTSNFDNTFIFGEPFDEPTLNGNRWTNITGNSIFTINTTEHYIEVTDMDAYHWWDGRGLLSRNFTMPESWIVQSAYENDGFKYYHTTTTAGELCGQSLHLSNATGSVASSLLGDYWAACYTIQEMARIGSDNWESGEFSVSLPYSTNWTFRKLNGNITCVQDSVVRIERPNDCYIDRVLWELARYESYGFGTERLYAFMIRKYVDPEPTNGDWGLEEEPTGNIGYNTTLTQLSDGPHTLITYANDTSGNMGSSDTVCFVVHNFVHDVALLNVATFKTVVGKGQVLNVTVTAENQGNVTESFNATVYANSTDIGTIEYVNLPGGSSATQVFSWNTSGYAKAYNMSAYALPVSGELNLTDNAYADGIIKVSCIGDVNGDYVTDAKDYQIVKKAIPSMPGSPKWNANADVNDDLVISAKDYQIIKNHIPSIDP